MVRRERTYYSNIYAPMFEIAFGSGDGRRAPILGGIVRDYKTDVAYDVLTLHAAPPHSVWAWGPREGGTHLLRLDGGNVPDASLLATLSVVPQNWWIIRLGNPWPDKGTSPQGTIEHLGSCTMPEVASRMGSILLELAMPSPRPSGAECY